MRSAILQGNPPIEVSLRRSGRARRMTLRVSRMDGRVTLTLPHRVSESEALEFVRSREDWMRQHLSQSAEHQVVELGTQLPILGEMCTLVPGAGRRVELEGGELRVPGAPEQVPRRVEAYLKTLARSELAFAADSYAKALGRDYTKLTLRDTRSRWGSCTSAGGLMFSWRLIMAPAEVLAYVAAHEVAHLQHMDHSSAFWATVQDLFGDHKPQRAWLRTDGHNLHQYRFRN